MRQKTAVLLLCIPLMTGFIFTGGIGITDVSAADTAEIRPETTENDTSIDTQTPPSRPGEVTNATSQNPSPSENRGQFAFPGEDASYTTADNVNGDVGNGATIFQGEKDITLRDANFDEVNPAELERIAGDNEGVTLSFPIPDDQAEGGYNNGAGFGVTVQEPRVTTLEVQNNGEEDVSGGFLEPGQNEASVFIEYNYEEAENIELTVEDENGVDITGEVLDSGEVDNKNADNAAPSGSAPDGSVRFEINPSNLVEGEYTFSVAGVEDLDSGGATQSVTTTASAGQSPSPSPSLSLNENASIQDSTRFSIESSLEGEFHPVVIKSNDFRDDITLAQAENVFRSVGDTAETGVVDNNGPGASAVSDVEYAYAIVEIDGGQGLGSIATQLLDGSSATVELYPSDGVTPIESHPAGVVLTTDDGFETIDDINVPLATDVTRTVSINETTPGETVTLTTEITGASGSVSTSSSYDPQLSSAAVESVTVNGASVDPLISEATVNGSTVTLGDAGTDATVTITEELTVGEELNVTHSITGDVTVGETTTDFEPVSVTVADTEPQSVVDEFDEDGNDNIEITELGQAGRAFASGDLTITELGQVGAAFAS